MQNKVTEGYMPFLGYQTYYRIVGEATGKAPLLLLHGGPGSTHNYFEVLDCIADTGRQVISYDQIGCGKSYLDGHPELWTLFLRVDGICSATPVTPASSMPTRSTARCSPAGCRRMTE